MELPVPNGGAEITAMFEFADIEMFSLSQFHLMLLSSFSFYQLNF